MTEAGGIAGNRHKMQSEAVARAAHGNNNGCRAGGDMMPCHHWEV